MESNFYRVQEFGADAAVVTPAGRVIGKFFGPEGLRHARNFCASISRTGDSKMSEIVLRERAEKLIASQQKQKESGDV